MSAPTGSSAPGSGALGGFGDYQMLIADLTTALEAGRAPAVFAVFELVDSTTHRQTLAEQAGADLIARCAGPFSSILGAASVCYRARHNEFCALVRTPIEVAGPLLFAAERALNAEDPLLAAACFGAVVLPDEAQEPVEVLILADERLRMRLSGRESRERRRAKRGLLARVPTPGRHTPRA
jgi:hypothetical protein